jgi:hypothetical protein
MPAGTPGDRYQKLAEMCGWLASAANWCGVKFESLI